MARNFPRTGKKARPRTAEKSKRLPVAVSDLDD